MQRTHLLLTLVLLFVCIAFAGNSLLFNVDGSYWLDIKRPAFGMGMEFGFNIDEMVNANVGAGFQKAGQKDVERSEPVDAPGGGTVIKKVTVAEETHWVFPLKSGLRVRLPIGGAVLPTISGGLGYLFYNYIAKDIKDSINTVIAELPTAGLYHGFCWEAGFGFDWKLGSRSSMVGDIVYQGSHPTNKNDYERNLSAIRFKLGLLLEL